MVNIWAGRLHYFLRHRKKCCQRCEINFKNLFRPQTSNFSKKSNLATSFFNEVGIFLVCHNLVACSLLNFDTKNHPTLMSHRLYRKNHPTLMCLCKCVWPSPVSKYNNGSSENKVTHIPVLLYLAFIHIIK